MLDLVVRDGESRLTVYSGTFVSMGYFGQLFFFFFLSFFFKVAKSMTLA